MTDQKKNEVMSKSTFQALGLAWELGYTITVPLVIFALLGRLADKWLGSSPWLLLLGVFLSIIISTWLVYRKAKVFVTPIENDKKDEIIDKPGNSGGNNK